MGAETRLVIASKPPADAVGKRGEYIFQNPADYILTVNVSGDNIPTQTAKLKIFWPGNVKDSSISII